MSALAPEEKKKKRYNISVHIHEINCNNLLDHSDLLLSATIRSQDPARCYITHTKQILFPSAELCLSANK